MSTANSDGRSKPAPDVSSTQRANLRRRGFLLTLGVGGAGAAAVAVRGLAAPVAMNVAAETISDEGGYAATAHVQQYYKTTKL
ncbi:MAG: formate dehydrogenase [Casimicrobiaceae bacterium]